MPRTGGKQDDTVEMYAKMRGAWGKAVPPSGSVENNTFHAQFEVFVWRIILQNPKKLIVPYGTITFGTLKVNDEAKFQSKF